MKAKKKVVNYYYWTFKSNKLSGSRVAETINSPFLFKSALEYIKKEIGEKCIITFLIKITKEQADNLGEYYDNKEAPL